MRTLSSSAVGSFMARRPFTSKEWYNFTLCLVVVLATVDFATRKLTANYTLMPCLAILLLLSSTSLPVRKWIKTKLTSLSRMISMNHVDPKVTFTKVNFRRESKEGFYISEADRYSVNAGKIESFGPGILHLDNGEVVYVEEDWDQINNILNLKLAEEEAYNQNMRDIDKMGIEPSSEGVA
jgi:hypothetical protein